MFLSPLLLQASASSARMQTDWIYFAVGSLLALLIIAFGLRWYGRMLGGLFKRSPLLGRTTGQRIVTLALTAALFRDAAYLVLISPLRMFYDVALAYKNEGLPVVRSLLTRIDRDEAPTAGQENSFNLLGGLLAPVQRFAENIFSPVSLLQFVLATLCAVVIARIIDKIFWDSSRNAYGVTHLNDGIKRMLVLLLITAASFYLVLCAIVSTSIIHESAGHEVAAPAGIDSALRLITGEERLAALYAPKTDTLILDDLDADLAALATVLPAAPSQSPAYTEGVERLQTLPATYREMEGALAAAAADHDKDVGDFKRFLVSYRQNIAAKYATQNDLSARVRREYYDQLVETYTYYTQANQTLLAAAAESLTDSRRRLRFSLDNDRRRIRQFYQNLSRGDTIDLPPYVGDYAYAHSEIYRRSYPFKVESPSLPHPDNSGRDRGWLGVTAAWLTNPKDMNLVLIVGMIGFGLFGASISSVVAKQAEEKKRKGKDADARDNEKSDQPTLGEEIARLLISGFSAAIVVFLATKGGIAIINLGTNEPNPYVLFFFCLAGAVFSERIWAWAKGVINRNYNEDGEHRDSSGVGDAAKKQATAAGNAAMAGLAAMLAAAGASGTATASAASITTTGSGQSGGAQQSGRANPPDKPTTNVDSAPPLDEELDFPPPEE